MTHDNQSGWPQQREPDPAGRVHSQSMNPELHYRNLERDYHRSAQYAAMVERYPQLKQSIASCQQGELIGEVSPLLPPQVASVQLEWERSHGED